MTIKLGCLEVSDQLVLSVSHTVRFVRCRVYRKVSFVGAKAEGCISVGGGSIQLVADALYRIHGVPIDVAGSKSLAYLSTLDSVPQELSEVEFQTALKHFFPEEADRVCVEQAKSARRHEQLKRIRHRGSTRAQRERNLAIAESITAEGQPASEYPPLTGSSKQVAFALDIRNEYALRHPDDRVLRSATRAQYWIENHKWILSQPD